MIKNIIFDIGNVIVTEKGASIFRHLNLGEQDELNGIIYRNSGFIETLLGNQTTDAYKRYLLRENPKYYDEIQTLLSLDGMPVAMPKKPEMVKLAYALKDKYHIYFLSDMIDITFTYLKDFLADFDGGAYSYQEHVKKPNEAFYQILLQRYNLNPEESFFFDDKPKNIAAAQGLGIQAKVFVDINDVRQRLHIDS